MTARWRRSTPIPRANAARVLEYLDETPGGKIIGEYRSMGLRSYTLEKAKMFGFDQPYLEACL